MKLARESFTHKWSDRFLRYSNGKRMPRSATSESWCEQLSKESAHCNWMRMVICTWNQVPIQGTECVKPLIHWLSETCMHPTFVKCRSTLPVSSGVQIWFSHQEDVAAFMVCMNEPIIHVRYMDNMLSKSDWQHSWSQKRPFV